MSEPTFQEWNDWAATIRRKEAPARKYTSMADLLSPFLMSDMDFRNSALRQQQLLNPDYMSAADQQQRAMLGYGRTAWNHEKQIGEQRYIRGVCPCCGRSGKAGEIFG